MFLNIKLTNSQQASEITLESSEDGTEWEERVLEFHLLEFTEVR